MSVQELSVKQAVGPEEVRFFAAGDEIAAGPTDSKIAAIEVRG
jgi:hypothetical protein